MNSPPSTGPAISVAYSTTSTSSRNTSFSRGWKKRFSGTRISAGCKPTEMAAHGSLLIHSGPCLRFPDPVFTVKHKTQHNQYPRQSLESDDVRSAETVRQKTHQQGSQG